MEEVTLVYKCDKVKAFGFTQEDFPQKSFKRINLLHKTGENSWIRAVPRIKNCIIQHGKV